MTSFHNVWKKEKTSIVLTPVIIIISLNVCIHNAIKKYIVSLHEAWTDPKDAMIYFCQ